MQDFLDAQPIRDAAVFYIRYVLHGWPDSYCEKILLNLRRAALPSTRMVIVDSILSHACPQAIDAIRDPKSIDIYPPPPLLTNAGHANVFGYLADYHVSSSSSQ